jgi:hypothetical protein
MLIGVIEKSGNIDLPELSKAFLSGRKAHAPTVVKNEDCTLKQR